MPHHHRARRLAPALLLLTALTGCDDDHAPLGIQRASAAVPRGRDVARRVASPPPARPGALTSVRIEGVPHVRQRPDFCGEACVEMALRKLGQRLTQNDVFAATGLSPTLGRGAVTRELLRGLRRLGFAPGRAWYWISARRPRRGLGRQFAALHRDLQAGVPSVVCTRFDEQPRTTEHFRLVIGYDARTDEVIYHDPALDRGASLRMKRDRLYRLWPLKYKKKRWIVIRMPLRQKSAGVIRAPSRLPGRFSRADFSQHVRKLRPRLKKLGGSFTIVVQPPFVVVGDEPPAAVRRRAAGTVKWAVDLLKRDYFRADPLHILDIYLFKDRSSYTRNTVRLFGSRPGTPYGFYSSDGKALVMNISTGGGTLVHEIVHPFMEANFPDCPPWFNEGLGSLYEQSARRGGKIWGLTNWRLPGLQKAIRAGVVPSFARLMSRTSFQFYQRDPGTNYSQSRYLLYYLQSTGKLRAYYRRFLRDHRRDPTGLQSLKAVLGVSDLDAFKRRWEAWVLALRYPPSS